MFRIVPYKKLQRTEIELRPERWPHIGGLCSWTCCASCQSWAGRWSPPEEEEATFICFSILLCLHKDSFFHQNHSWQNCWWQIDSYLTFVTAWLYFLVAFHLNICFARYLRRIIEKNFGVQVSINYSLWSNQGHPQQERRGFLQSFLPSSTSLEISSPFLSQVCPQDYGKRNIKLFITCDHDHLWSPSIMIVTKW